MLHTARKSTPIAGDRHDREVDKFQTEVQAKAALPGLVIVMDDGNVSVCSTVILRWSLLTRGGQIGKETSEESAVLYQIMLPGGLLSGICEAVNS